MALASKGLPLLFGLGPAAFELLDRHARESVVSPGHVILREGEPGRHLFLIERGMVRVLKARSGQEWELARLREGGFFGELSLLDPNERSADVVAVEETGLVILPKVAFEILFDQCTADYARFLENLARELARRMRVIVDRFVERPGFGSGS